MSGDVPDTVPENAESQSIDATSPEIILLGLDPLNSTQQVFFHRSARQSVLPNEIRYDIVDDSGWKLFEAVEHNYKLSRKCCDDLRKFEMSILQTHDQQEILRFRRPLRGDCCCCFGCRQSLDILSCPDYAIIGSIVQEWSICRPQFVIKLPNGETLFRVTGPCCTMRCCVRELEFNVSTYNRQGDVALISSEWAGFLRDQLAEVNFYGVDFRQEVDNKMKALILGACVLVNTLYYKI